MHSILSPSKAARWIHCPGSLRLEALFDNESNEAAEEGKKAHEYCYNVLRNLITPNTSLEMIKFSQAYINYIYSLTTPKSINKYEIRVDLPSVHPEMFGTVDALIKDNNKLHIIDFKYGFYPVEVVENWQLLCYAIGAFDQGFDAEEIHLTIVQPRAFHKDGIIRTWTINVFMLEKYRALLKRYADEAMKPNAPLNAGEHCKFCKARATCETLSQSVINMAQYVKSQPRFESMGQELKFLKKCNKMINDRIDVLTYEIISRLQKGNTIKEYELQQGMSRRKWSIPIETIVKLGEENNINLTTVVTPAEAERLGLPRSILDDITTREKNSYTLREIQK